MAKIAFRGSPLIFISISVCKVSNKVNSLELTSHKIVHSINEKRYDFLKNVHFGFKNQFSGILMFLRIFCSDLVGVIGFLEAVDMD